METSQALPLPSNHPSIPTGEELTYRIQGSIDMYDRDNKIHRHGIVTLTSHYLHYYTDNNKQKGLRWHLEQVTGIETEEGGLFGSAKIIVKLRHFVQQRSLSTVHGTTSTSTSTTTATVTTSTTTTSTTTAYVKLSFKEGGRDAFFDDLKKALQRKAWIITDHDNDPLANYGMPSEKKHRHNTNVPTPAEPPQYRPGLQGVLDQRAKRMEASKALATEAFSDLDNLAIHAKKIVTLAENYAIESQRNKLNSSTNGEGTSTTEENNALGALISDMGIITPVTKEIAGKLYLQEVARQLVIYIRPKLSNYGGMMPLTDIYCLYNRARGTDPISPEDLVEALRLAPKMGLGVQLRTFGSEITPLHDTTVVAGSNPTFSSSSLFKPSSLLPGSTNGKKGNDHNDTITVLQLDSFQDDVMQTRIIDMLDQKEQRTSSPSLPWTNAYVSAVELATEWRLPLTITKQLLLQAEKLGVLCRDDSIAGLRFYLNHFS